MGNNSDAEKFCLSWSQFVPSMVATLKNLHDNVDSKDVTLISEDGIEVKCHRFILNSTSGFFNKLFVKGSYHKDSIVYLTHINSSDLKSILKFMYLGEVFLEQDSLNSFMFAANKLMVKGLSDFHQDVVQPPLQEQIVKYEYQKPQDPIDVIQHQSKTDFDPFQEFIDGLSIKKEKSLNSPCPSDNGTFSVPVVDVINPQPGSGAAPSPSNDPIPLQFVDLNRVDTEYVVTSADSSIQSFEQNQKYYKCMKCDYKSTKMFNVKKHTQAVHDGVRYPCKFCDYKATETGHLRKHVRARHGDQLKILDKTL